jgi:hypothetical protein
LLLPFDFSPDGFSLCDWPAKQAAKIQTKAIKTSPPKAGLSKPAFSRPAGHKTVRIVERTTDNFKFEI